MQKKKHDARIYRCLTSETSQTWSEDCLMDQCLQRPSVLFLGVVILNRFFCIRRCSLNLMCFIWYCRLHAVIRNHTCGWYEIRPTRSGLNTKLIRAKAVQNSVGAVSYFYTTGISSLPLTCEIYPWNTLVIFHAPVYL